MRLITSLKYQTNNYPDFAPDLTSYFCELLTCCPRLVECCPDLLGPDSAYPLARGTLGDA
jgi:hypothetical protein